MRSLQRVGRAQSATARPGFPVSLQTGLGSTYPPHHQRVDSSPQYRGTGLARAPLLQNSRLSSQLNFHAQRIHFYWDIFPILGSWHSYCCTEYSTNPRGSCGLFLLSPMHDCTTAKQRELHSNVNPSGYIPLSKLLIFKQYQGASNTTAFESLKSSSIFENSEDGELFWILPTLNCKPK